MSHNQRADTPMMGATPTDTAPNHAKTGGDLSLLSAVWASLSDRSLEFYPRLGSPVKSIKSDELIDGFYLPDSGAMKYWDKLHPQADGIDGVIDLAKASLAEAKAQTEYQDQKAIRLLTVTTFLTALAGAFFTSFANDFPPRTLLEQSVGTLALLLPTYLAFLLFVLCALAGSLVTFHATRTRFKYPTNAKVKSQEGPTRSFLFYREIIGVTPAGWANSFVTVEQENGVFKATLKKDLKIEYLKNYVSEAYLIAAKTADKLRFLQPAQSLLAWALRCLMVYILFLTAALAFLPPTKPAASPSEVKLITMPQPVQMIMAPAPESQAADQEAVDAAQARREQQQRLEQQKLQQQQFEQPKAVQTGGGQ